MPANSFISILSVLGHSASPSASIPATCCAFADGAFIISPLLFVLLLILFIIEKSANKNHIFSHSFGYYCRIYFDKQLICMSNKLWRLHESNLKWTQSAQYKYQMYDFTWKKNNINGIIFSHDSSTLNGIQVFGLTQMLWMKCTFSFRSMTNS